MAHYATKIKGEEIIRCYACGKTPSTMDEVEHHYFEYVKDGEEVILCQSCANNRDDSYSVKD